MFLLETVQSKCAFTPEISIGGLSVMPASMDTAVDYVMQEIAEQRNSPFVATAINAHFVVEAQTDARLRAFLNKADLPVADGVSLLLAAKMLGQPLPERITGIDLMVRLCARAGAEGKSIYLLGGRPGAAARAAETLTQTFSRLRIAGVDRPPFGREFDSIESAKIRERIQLAKPDLLFVCLGVPRQEYWIEQFAMDLPVSFVMGNGAAFDVLAGHFERPAQWVQDCGMEWLYRLLMEPRRLARRYLVGNPKFLGIVMKQLLRNRSVSSSEAPVRLHDENGRL